MGKHRQGRPTPPPSRLRALQNVALPVALLLVVGVIAFASPLLRQDAPETPLTDRAASVDPPPPPSSSPTKKAKDRNRPGTNLAFKAEIVQGIAFKELPPIPKGFVRVDPVSTQPTSFTVSSFNLLGHGHTVPGGNKKGWANSATRMGWQVSLMRAHNVSVAGFQEFQAAQFHSFNRLTGGSYGVFPGLGMGVAPVQNSIVWRTSDWELVEAGTSPIPYFRGSIPMPHVLLRNVRTGQQVWFANYHNPADAHGPAEAKRNAATSIQIGLFNRLTADGTPIVVTGDMNERTDYLCPVASRAGLRSANGGYADAGGCHPPARMDVDWIFGSQPIDFSGFISDRGPLVSRSTDHPMVRSLATLPPVNKVGDCVRHPVRKDELYCPR